MKVRHAAGGHKDSPAKRGRWWYLPRWPDRRPLPMTIKFRGGAECWYEVHARGAMGRFPGTAALNDVMREVMRRD